MPGMESAPCAKQTAGHGEGHRTKGSQVTAAGVPTFLAVSAAVVLRGAGPEEGRAVEMYSVPLFQNPSGTSRLGGNELGLRKRPEDMVAQSEQAETPGPMAHLSINLTGAPGHSLPGTLSWFCLCPTS